VAADGEGASADIARELTTAAAARPVTIADGHHRYETALQYRDERRMTRSCEEDPAFDYLLTLFLEATGEPLTVLPTHRIVTGVTHGGEMLVDRARDLFDVEPVESASAILELFERVGLESGGRGRFGLWTRSGGALLTARRGAFANLLPPGGDALRALDVSVLSVALEQLLGVDGAAVARGAVAYTKSAREAVDQVDSVEADAAFLLEGTPVASIEAVARAGDVMPQKSTYFYPKALSGLVINPHEW
jgi:uncharacterized protein (DUF1015 family)